MTKEAKILIIDDEPANVRLLVRILEIAGYKNFRSTTDPKRGVELFHEDPPDLVLTDLHMPVLNGFAVMQNLRASMGAASFTPII
ncbi:MAG TPA: response regulator, partial [Verrucomicrobiae bacterium]